MTLDLDVLKAQLVGSGFYVDHIRDGLGKGIEEGIKPLVIVLNTLGYRTTSSCEGHGLDVHLGKATGRRIEWVDIFRFHLPHQHVAGVYTVHDQAPYVDVEPDQMLRDLVARYNNQQSIPWYLSDGERTSRLSPDYRNTLKTLQGTVMPFATFLFENKK